MARPAFAAWQVTFRNNLNVGGFAHPIIDSLPRTVEDAKQNALPSEPGEDLLRGILIDEQWYDYKAGHGFSLRGSDGELYYYAIGKGCYNVYSEHREYQYCAELNQLVPKADKVTATVLFLGANASGYKAVANRCRVTSGNDAMFYRKPTDYGGRI